MRKIYNEILGRDDSGQVVVLDETFEHSAHFKGAVGSCFEVITGETVRNQLDDFSEYVEDLWRLAVSEGDTHEGLSAWVDYNFPTEEAKREYLYDDSYSEYHATIKATFGMPDDTVISCIGGGRIFPRILGELNWIPGKREKFEPIILAAESE